MPKAELPPGSAAATSQAADRNASICTCFAVRRLNRRLTQFYDRQMQPTGLKTTQYSLLSWLEQRGALPMAELAHRMGMERSTLTRNVQPLIGAGWVRQRPAAADRDDPRAMLLELTAAGSDQFRLARQQWRGAQQKINKLVGARRLVALHAMIDQTLKTLPDDGLA
jgi:DNA-binding MarR family transcriptional regulator